MTCQVDGYESDFSEHDIRQLMVCKGELMQMRRLEVALGVHGLHPGMAVSFFQFNAAPLYPLSLLKNTAGASLNALRTLYLPRALRKQRESEASKERERARQKEVEDNPLLSFRAQQIKRNGQLLADLGLNATVAKILSRRDEEQRTAEAVPPM